MLTNIKESVHVKPQPIGVGYLHHCIPAHQKYFQRAVGIWAAAGYDGRLGCTFRLRPRLSWRDQ